MNEFEFQLLLEKIGEYLKEKKTFVENPFRVTEIKSAATIAHELFPDARLCINDDPLQTGSLYLHIELTDINLSDEREIKLFADIISLCDNFEIYAHTDGYIVFALLFQNAFIRIQ